MVKFLTKTSKSKAIRARLMRRLLYFSITLVFVGALVILWVPKKAHAQTDTFTSSGNWTVPPGVTSAVMEAWGGGGAGRGCASKAIAAGGAAGGQYAKVTITVNPGDTYTVAVGTGAPTQTANANGGSGGDSIVTSPLSVQVLVAKGGAGGTNAGGGVGSTTGGVGDVVHAGGSGDPGGANSYGGAGGGGAGSTGAGGSASGLTAGTGTAINGGNGGAGVTGAAGSLINGNPGSNYGGGGSGGYNSQSIPTGTGSGAAGGAGLVTMTYTPPAQSSPAAPTLSTPSSGATGVSALPTFQLRTTDVDGDYLRYKILVCANSGCGTIVTTNDQTISQTGWTGQDQQTGTAYTGSATIGSSTMANFTYQLPPLAKNTQYWWEAFAIDPGGSSIWSSASSIQTFTTGDDAPQAPVLFEPVNSGSGNSVLTTFKLHSAELNSDYVEYKIQVCADSGCGTIIRTIDETSSQTGWSGQDQQSGAAYTGNPNVSSSTLATHTYQSPYLSANTTYWWRAYAIDPGGSNTWSPSSAIQAFTTAPTETQIHGNVQIKGNTNISG